MIKLHSLKLLSAYDNYPIKIARKNNYTSIVNFLETL